MRKTIITLSIAITSASILSGCGSNKKEFAKDKNGKLTGLEIPPEYNVRPAKDWKDEEKDK